MQIEDYGLCYGTSEMGVRLWSYAMGVEDEGMSC